MKPRPRCSRVWLALAFALAGVGCRRDHGAPSPATSSSATAPHVASSADAPSGGLELRAPPEEPPPLDLGPDASLAAGEREQRMADLLQGRAGAARFPLIDFDRGSAYVEGQFRGLTTVVVDTDTGVPPARPPRVLVKVDPPVVLEGAPDLVNLQRVTAGMRAGFRNCYARFATLDRTKPPPRMELSMLVRVDREGNVTDTTWARPPTNESLGLCIQARTKSGQFEAQPKILRYRIALHLAPDE